MLRTERRAWAGLAALTAGVGMFGVQLVAPSNASANEYAPQLQRFLDERVRPFLGDPIVIGSIREQNAAHAGMSDGEIDTLDQQWRAEARAGSGPLLDE